VLTVVLLAVVLGACSAGGSPSAGQSGPAGSPGAGDIVAEVATYQMVAGRPGRLLVAVLTADQHWVSFGSVNLSFSYMGDGSESPPAAQAMPDAVATYLPIPDTPTGEGQAPTITLPTDGHGVYSANPVTFPQVGFWQVTVQGQLQDGTPFSTQTAEQVLDAPTVVSVGDPAPHTKNPVMGDADVAPVAIDSRAQGDESIPDPELHHTSIADAIDAGRPALVVFSTPVYCVSRFCGPVTDLVQQLADEYSDRADFIHIEIWKDFQAGELNQAAVDWLMSDAGDFREPWTFLIGSDGRIAGSWDTVVTRGEIEPLLQALPGG